MFLFEKSSLETIVSAELKKDLNDITTPADKYLKSARVKFLENVCKFFEDKNNNQSGSYVYLDFSQNKTLEKAVSDFNANKNDANCKALIEQIYLDPIPGSTPEFETDIKDIRSNFLDYLIKNAENRYKNNQDIDDFYNLRDYLGINDKKYDRIFNQDSQKASSLNGDSFDDKIQDIELSHRPNKKDFLSSEAEKIARTSKHNFSDAMEKFYKLVSDYENQNPQTAFNNGQDKSQGLKPDWNERKNNLQTEFIEDLVGTIGVDRYDKEAKKRQKISSAIKKDPEISAAGSLETWANSLSLDQNLEKMFYSEVVKLQKNDDIEEKIKKAVNRKSAELMVKNYFKEIIGKQGYNYKDKNGYEHDIQKNTMPSKISDEELEHWLNEPKNKQNQDKFQMYMGTVDSVFPGRKTTRDSEKTFSVASEIGGLMQLGAALLGGRDGIDMVNDVKDFAVNSQIGKFISKQKELADDLKDDPEAYREEQNKILNRNYEKSINKVFNAETRKIKELKNNVWKAIKDAVTDKDKTKKELDKLFEDIDNCVSEIRELQKDLALESDLNVINSIEDELNSKKADKDKLKQQIEDFCEKRMDSEKAKRVLEIFESIESAVDSEVKKISSVRSKGVDILDTQIKNGKRNFKNNIKDYWDELNKSKVVKAATNAAKKGYDYVKKNPRTETVKTKI